jgi:hypothetical protein
MLYSEYRMLLTIYVESIKRLPSPEIYGSIILNLEKIDTAHHYFICNP